MQIGIDASRALSTAPTGTEGYSYHLIRALLAARPANHSIRLYFRQPPTVDFPGADLCVIPFPHLWTHLRLAWEMARRPPDVLFVPAHVLPPVLPRISLVTVHDLGYLAFPEAHPFRQRLYLDWSTRWNVRAATHVLADSQATRDAIVETYHTSPDKITVVYPGYDAALKPVRDPQALVAVRARYGIPGDYILAIGRIQPRKNLTRLVNAFARVLPQHPNLTLVLAGPTGWLADPLLAHVRAQGLESRVCFPGYVAEADKATLISGAQVFAFPSLYEGFGFPALEAQVCETPLLASNTTSLPEVAGDGALLVDPLNEDEITQGLLSLLGNNDLRQTLVARGRANLERFSWEMAAEAVIELINQFDRPIKRQTSNVKSLL